MSALLVLGISCALFIVGISSEAGIRKKRRKLSLNAPAVVMDEGVTIDLNALPSELWMEIFSQNDTRTLGRLNQGNKELHSLTESELARRKLEKIMPKMVELKAGAFLMGPSSEETPALGRQSYQVIEKDFRLGVDPVTQEQFEAVMGKARNQSRHKGPRLPITNLNRRDVVEYIQQLNQEVARLWAIIYPVYPESKQAPPSFRIPTEVEWEYATTEPLETPERVSINGETVEITARHMKYSGTNDERDFHEYADFNRPRKKDGPLAVDLGKGGVPLKLNSRGIRGMSGKVWEMTSTLFWPENDAYIVIRGGRWSHDAQRCRSSFRQFVWVGTAGPGVGLRLVSD